MRIEQLEAFLAIAETGGFQQAALQRGITQSTISRQIQSLEQGLGLPLFQRTTPVRLTIAGERFLPRARRILQEWHNASQEIRDLLQGKQPELCVAAIYSLCSSYLPPVLQQFCQTYPEVQLRVTALGSDRALKVLRDGLVDVAIVMNNRLLTNSPELAVEVLFEEPIEVLMATDHPLTRYPSVPWSLLADYPQVVFKDGYGMQRIIYEQFAQRSLHVQAALELNTPDAFRGMVRQGKMVALLPRSALIDAIADPSLTIRPLAPETRNISNVTSITEPAERRLTRQVVLVTTHDRLQIPPIQKFYQLVLQQAPHYMASLHLPESSDSLNHSLLG